MPGCLVAHLGRSGSSRGLLAWRLRFLIKVVLSTRRITEHPGGHDVVRHVLSSEFHHVPKQPAPSPWPCLRSWRSRPLRSASLVAALAACAPIRGYPDDPEDTSATLTRLTPYFDGTEEAQYVALPNDATLRQQKRDEIVLARIRAYDIEFADFEQKLYLEGNSVSTGSDLLVLILAGLTATTGNAATKAALGAASAGVIGAQAAISKDIYYQKTIPALLEQMEANRTNAKLTIFKGLTTPDAQYPLTKAYLDLDALKAAGSIPGAIASITQQAGNAKTTAQGEIDIMRISGICPASNRHQGYSGSGRQAYLQPAARVGQGHSAVSSRRAKHNPGPGQRPRSE